MAGNGCPRDLFYLLVLALMGMLTLHLQAECGEHAVLTPSIIRHKLRSSTNIPVVLVDTVKVNPHAEALDVPADETKTIDTENIDEASRQMDQTPVAKESLLDQNTKSDQVVNTRDTTDSSPDFNDALSSEMYDDDSEPQKQDPVEVETAIQAAKHAAFAIDDDAYQQVDNDRSAVDSESVNQDVTSLEGMQGSEQTSDDDSDVDVEDDVLSEHDPATPSEEDGDEEEEASLDDGTSTGEGSNLSKYFDLHFTDPSGREDPIIILKPQFKHTKHKFFKVVRTKSLSLMRAFQANGWIMQSAETFPTVNAGLVLTKPVTAVLGSRGRMISQISASSCIGGSKGSQLRCRKNLAKRHGCNFDDLKISPAQYNLWSQEECTKFFEISLKPENQNRFWIGKHGGSYHGRGINISQGVPSKLVKKYSKCSTNRDTGEGFIMMDYIHSPATLNGHKFDLRTYMLIAATTPYLVFYHDGFVRRSGAKYSSDLSDKMAHITNHAVQDKMENHFWGFEQTGKVLTTEFGFPSDFMQRKFKNRAKHVTNYVFQAAREKMNRRGGSFMIFGLDWVIDSDQGIHLLEANGNPSIRPYPGTDLTPAIWNDMAALVTQIHREPEGINPVVANGYKWGGWELIFSEPEEVYRNKVYDACKFEEYSRCTDPEVCDRW